VAQGAVGRMNAAYLAKMKVEQSQVRVAVPRLILISSKLSLANIVKLEEDKIIQFFNGSDFYCQVRFASFSEGSIADAVTLIFDVRTVKYADLPWGFLPSYEQMDVENIKPLTHSNVNPQFEIVNKGKILCN